VRLRTLTTLRWLAVSGQAAAIFTVHFGLGFPTPLGLCLGVMAASAWLNLFVALRFSPQKILSDREAAAYIAFDIVQLCALLFLTGGLRNPFSALILAPVTIAASILPLRHTAAIAALAVAGISVLSARSLPLPWRPTESLVMPDIYVAGVWAALTLSVVFFTAYARRVSAEQAQMKDALEATQLVLAREERLNALGGLAAAAAHELGTPLATIQLTAAEMAKDLEGKGALGDDAKLLVSQAKRCREILGRLSNLGAEGDAILDRIGVDTLIREAAEPFLDGARGPVVIFDLTGEGAAPVVRRRPEVLYGLRNFIENAASFARSKVLVTAQWTKDTIAISVHDDGPGFAQDVLARLGEPYLSQRLMGRKTGMGLGFFIAKTLLERSGAKIAYDNAGWSDGSGSRGAWVSAAWRRADLAAPVG